MKATRKLIHKALHNPSNNSLERSYATNRVFSPKPTTSSQESIINNPIISFSRGNKPSTLVQHPEWVKDYCNMSGCAGKTCETVCGNTVSSKSIGHFTHSNNEKHNPQKVSDIDLDEKPKPLYAKPYEMPHETSGQSYDPEGDIKKTESLKKKLKDIENESKHQQ